MAETGKATLGSIEKAFDIVNRLEGEDSMGVTELATETGLHKSTVHSYLRTLEALGYVVNDDGTYRLSLQFYTHGANVRNRLPIYRKGRGAVRELAEETGEIANAGTIEGNRVFVLFIAEGNDAVRDRSKPGNQLPVHSTALGKAILAHLPDPRIDAVFERSELTPFTENTITERGQLREELTTVRERGFAVDAEETNLGIYCIAAPVLDEDQTPLGAVSVSGPVQRLNDREYHDAVRQGVVNAANVIEVKIQFERQ